MAQRNLRAAAAVVERQVHPQAEGFTEHRPWDFEHTAEGQ
jgi:hypothetical protein